VHLEAIGRTTQPELLPAERTTPNLGTPAEGRRPVPFEQHPVTAFEQHAGKSAPRTSRAAEPFVVDEVVLIDPLQFVGLEPARPAGHPRRPARPDDERPGRSTAWPEHRSCQGQADPRRSHHPSPHRRCARAVGPREVYGPSGWRWWADQTSYLILGVPVLLAVVGGMLARWARRR
jgi:hypothetical protein